MTEPATCGEGLAAHSALPAKLGELIAALAENLEVHQSTLDLTDENARKEHDAYVKLGREYRSIAAHLQATAQHMAGYRDLPMARHDERAMASPKVLEAFAKFVTLEQELLALLETAVARDQKMLAGMHARPDR